MCEGRGRGEYAKRFSQSRPEQSSDSGSQRHRECSPKRHTRDGPPYGRAPGAGGQRAQQREEEQRTTLNNPDERGYWHRQDQQERQGGTDCKSARRSKCRLNWSRAQGVGDAQFITRMGTECILGHQLGGDFTGESGVEASRDINGRQLGVLMLWVCSQLTTFPSEIGIFSIGLGTDGNVFTCGHRHRARHQTGNPCDQNASPVGFRRGHAHDQTCR